MRLTRAPLACPRCGRRDFFRNGSSRFLCRGCGRTFSSRKPFPRSRFPSAVVLEALCLSACGFSDSAMLSHLGRRHSARLSRQTLSAWRRRFGADWMDYAAAFGGRELSLEEICAHVGKDAEGLF